MKSAASLYITPEFREVGSSDQTATQVSCSYVEEEKPDAVVLATGSSPLKCQCSGNGRTYTAHDVLGNENIVLKERMQ